MASFLKEPSTPKASSWGAGRFDSFTPNRLSMSHSSSFLFFSTVSFHCSANKQHDQVAHAARNGFMCWAGAEAGREASSKDKSRFFLRIMLLDRNGGHEEKDTPSSLLIDSAHLQVPLSFQLYRPARLEAFVWGLVDAENPNCLCGNAAERKNICSCSTPVSSAQTIIAFDCSGRQRIARQNFNLVQALRSED